MNKSALPTIDVARPRLPEADEVLPYLRRIDSARWYSNGGPLSRELEERLADRFDVAWDRLVSCASGTSGLIGALLTEALPGRSHVILPAWTFAATAHAVLAAGFKPFMIDCDPDTGCITPAAANAARGVLHNDVAAVIVVAPFGLPVDAGSWATWSRKTGTPVIVDAAAGFDGLQPAPVTQLVSLHATKIFGTGEGGFLVARENDTGARLRAALNFGFRGSREALGAAINGKMSEYTAAVGLAGLDGYSARRARLMDVAQHYRSRLGRAVWQPGWGERWVATTANILLPEGRGEVGAWLTAQGIETRRWWNGGLHRHPAFADLPHTDLPVTDHLGRHVIGLPMHVDLTPADIDRIALALEEALHTGPADLPRGPRMADARSR